MKIGHYLTLQIEHTATEDEIKKAFRKLAHIYHPDKNGGNDTEFKKINSAYIVLSNSAKRSAYDIQMGLIQNRPQVIHIKINYGGTSWEQTGYWNIF